MRARNRNRLGFSSRPGLSSSSGGSRPGPSSRPGGSRRAGLGRAPQRIFAFAGATATLLFALSLAMPSIAAAAGLLYFSHVSVHALHHPESGAIERIALQPASSEGPQTLFETAEKTAPSGIALEPATGRIYWSESSAGQILGAPIGSSSAGEGGQSSAQPEVLFEGEAGVSGLTVDPQTKRLYWVNTDTNEVLSGGIGGKAEGPPAVLYKDPEGSKPVGIVVDPATSRLYWTDKGSGEIRSGGIGGEGTGEKAETLYGEGEEAAAPAGIAIDAATGALYWADEAGVNGKGYGEVRTGSIAGRTAQQAKRLLKEAKASTKPYGLALDPAAGKIYWSDFGSGTIDEAPITGEEAGGKVTAITATEAEGPRSLAVLMPPAAVALPIANGADAAGEKLSCSTGTWGSDQPESSFYEALSSLSYQWLLDGSPLPGASGQSVIPAIGGSYSCSVTAENAAGATVQVSAGAGILAPAPTATITSPGSGGTYTQGEVVPTSFFCTEGPGGPGLASCDDQYGADTLSGGSGHLETSMIGPHVYVVEAISKDGRRTGAIITYEVIPRVITAALPGVRIAAARASVLHGEAEVKLDCAAGARCAGKLTLRARVKVGSPARGTGRHGEAPHFRTVVLGHARYVLAAGQSRLLTVRLTRRALSLLQEARDHRMKALLLVSVSHGKSVDRKVLLLAGRHLSISRPQRRRRR